MVCAIAILIIFLDLKKNASRGKVRDQKVEKSVNLHLQLKAKAKPKAFTYLTLQVISYIYIRGTVRDSHHD
jgi:hypothetical protein